MNELNYSWDSVKQIWYEPNNSIPVEYIGNTGDVIDWFKVIDSVKNNPGTKLPRTDWDNVLVQNINQSLIDSEYCTHSCEWINYYPDDDYDSSINQLFGQVVGKPNYARAWISRINPGKTAPWHWDIDDNEPEYLSKGNLVRYICKMGEISLGHATLIGGSALHGGKSGDIYRWPDHRMWHGGANVGFVPKYQFNYLAYE